MSERLVRAAPAFAEIFRTADLPLVRVQMCPAPAGFEDAPGLQARVCARLLDRQTGEPAGTLRRQLYEKDGKLYVRHLHLYLLDDYQRQDISKTLEAHAIPLYRDLGVSDVKIGAVGKGSLVAAKAAYVLDLDGVRRRRDGAEVTDDALRVRAIEEIVHCPGVNQPHPVDPHLPGTRIEGPQSILSEVRLASAQGAERVAEFERRIPSLESLADADSNVFREPADLFAFAHGEELAGLPEKEWLGEAVGRRSRWSGVKRL